MMAATSKTLWDAMSAESAKHNEHRDCTVRALAIATGLDYDVCHAQLKKQGRKDRHGCHWIIEGPKAAKALGFNMRQLNRSEYRAKTMITVERDRNLRKGRYAVLIRSHVAGLVDGKIIDWSQGRRHRIQAVYECTPIPGFAIPDAPMRDPIPNGSAKWLAFTKYKKSDNLELF